MCLTGQVVLPVLARYHQSILHVVFLTFQCMRLIVPTPALLFLHGFHGLHRSFYLRPVALLCLLGKLRKGKEAHDFKKVEHPHQQTLLANEYYYNY